MSAATLVPADSAAPGPIPAPVRPGAHPALRERGMATIEYAMGVVVVLVIIGVVIAAIQTGTFQQLIEQLLGAIMGWVEQAFKIPLPFPKP
ncbi:hypothetical protein G7070_05390 [Propioniciclava coleopterorum]|uniref:DUF4244 domain-containing protein n=1 Tax=Propioniciclava coleopterorum TaxID=2714937 RepID=A0A6G7Y4V3_9ACTN|nr:hypothetical protein [Propioniciclava coleopterorum]QIK71813.1 hypothetical protein G7070_05390 [Propioniciclava coleopterorum]